MGNKIVVRGGACKELNPQGLINIVRMKYNYIDVGLALLKASSKLSEDGEMRSTRFMSKTFFCSFRDYRFACGMFGWNLIFIFRGFSRFGRIFQLVEWINQVLLNIMKRSKMKMMKPVFYASKNRLEFSFRDFLSFSHVFAVFDRDHDGTIDFHEFLLAVAAGSPGDLDSHLRYVFEM